MSAPARSSGQSRSGPVGSYYFCIEGLPRRYTWQDLKDLIRQEASHGIWTEMAFFPNGQTGETGWARVQRRDEAGSLFKFLATYVAEGRQLTVHLFDTSEKEPKMVAHTCPRQGIVCVVARQTPMIPRLAVNQSLWRAVNSGTHGQPGTAYAAQPSVSYAAAPMAGPPPVSAAYSPSAGTTRMDSPQSVEAQLANMSMHTGSDPAAMLAKWNQYQAQLQAHAQAQAQAQAHTQIRQQYQSMAPLYMSSPNGIMVNTDQGIVRTETRGIFVSKLDFSARTDDVKYYFGKAGKVVKCEIQKDPSTGKSKGNATILYDSAKHARLAVDMFHRQKFKSMRLDVRLDKEATAVGVPSSSNSKSAGSSGKSCAAQQSKSTENPIIVNGSVCQR